MKRLLPTQSDIESDPDQPATVIDISDTRGDAIFEALSSATARQILTAVYEKPRSASDLAEQTDTSLQNINYHIEKLQEVD
ncbi:MAG: ArsR/SmtB family transcription factor, partial [Halobacteriaceae archaeon]